MEGKIRLWFKKVTKSKTSSEANSDYFFDSISVHNICEFGRYSVGIHLFRL